MKRRSSESQALWTLYCMLFLLSGACTAALRDPGVAARKDSEKNAAPAAPGSIGKESTPQVQIAESSRSITMQFTDAMRVVLDRSGAQGLLGFQSLSLGDQEVLSSVPRKEGQAFSLEVLDAQTVGTISSWEDYLARRTEIRADHPDEESIWQWQSQGKRATTTYHLKDAIYSGYGIDKGSAFIRLSLNVDGHMHAVRWVFTPVRLRLGERSYSGIGWSFQLNDLDKATWLKIDEPVKAHPQDWFFTQSWGRFYEKRMGVGGTFSIPPEMPKADENWYNRKAWYNGDTLPFFFTAGRNGATVSFFEDPIAARVRLFHNKAAIINSFEIPLGVGTQRKTPTKYWLFCKDGFATKWDALNEWTSVYDAIAQNYQASLQLQEADPRPTLEWLFPSEEYLYTLQENPRIPLEKSWFVKLAETVIPRASDLGFKVIYVQTPWESDMQYTEDRYLPNSQCFGSGHAPWRLDISKAMGGMPALRQLTQAAHERGIKILLWITPAHLSNSSPLLKAHPEWIKWRQDGTPEDAGYLDIVGTGLRSGWYDYALGQYERVFRDSGVDGVWIDSFLTFVMYPDYSLAQPGPELHQAAKLQRAFWNMGLTEVRIEGNGLLGLSTDGYGNEFYTQEKPGFEEVFHAAAAFERIKAREYGLYRYVADTLIEPESYYRTLASKGAISVANLKQIDQLSANARQGVIQANRDHAKVIDKMEKRKLIGEGDVWKGVAWHQTGSDDIVLFAFEHFGYALTRAQTVTDITNNKALDAGSVLTTRPSHTYVIRGPR